MQKFKKIIISIVIILLIVIMIIILSIVRNKKAVKEEANLNVITYVEKYTTEKVKNSIDFYTVKNICNTYVQNLLYKSSEDLYNQLDPEYIKEFDITKSNVISKLSRYNFEENDYLTLEVIVKDMYSIKNENSIYTFFVYGYVVDNIKHNKNDFKCIVELSKENNTFYILPEDYMEKHNYTEMSEGKEIETSIKDIKTNGIYNKYDTIVKEDEEIISDYFNQYKNSLIYDKKEAYELLDKDYREKRFKDFENFENYVNKNIKNLYLATLDKYQVKNKNDYIQYICVDTEGRYYIFNQYSIAEFRLMLDTYTLDLPEFLEKYNSTNEQGKVVLNIQKFIDAINSYDYNYAYNCLSAGFKTNYFKTVQDFEKYIESTLYAKNEVSYESFEEQSGLYKYKVKITNKENQTESTTKTFIVKLNDGTDFEMSFNVD